MVTAGITGRDLMLIGGPPLVLVGLLGSLTVLRPALGWNLLLATLLLAGVGAYALGYDTRSEDKYANPWELSEDADAGEGRDAQSAGEFDAPPALQLLKYYCLVTLLLCLLYVGVTWALQASTP